MFDYSALHWMTFFAAALLLVIAPGPDSLFIIGRTLRGGRRAGYAAMMGVWVGAFGHVVMAAAGLSAIVVASAQAFTLVKWIGAAYLMWLGISTLRNRGGRLDVSENGGACAPDLWRIVRQGTLVCLLNPKVAVFFLAFLPQFVEPGAGPAWTQMFLHGTLIVALAALLQPLMVLAADGIAARLRGNPRFGLWLERVLGGIFIALGLKLALSER